MQLDDLDGLEEAGRLLREAHRQHGTDTEVRGDEQAGAGRLGELGAYGRQPLVRPAGGADDGVDAVGQAELQVAQDGVRKGEVDRDLGARLGQRAERVAAAEGRDQFHVVGALDGAYGLGAHPALCAEDGYSQLAHCARSLRVREGEGRAGDREAHATASCR